MLLKNVANKILGLKVFVSFREIFIQMVFLGFIPGGI